MKNCFSMPLWGVMVLALLVRGGVLGSLADGFQQDTDNYRQLAITLRETGTYGFAQAEGDLELGAEARVKPSAFRPPLYPVLLSVLVSDGELSATSLAGLHLLLGLATVWLTYRMATDAGLGNWNAVAALLVACDPILLYQSTQLMTETLATLLAVSVAALCMWASRDQGESATPWKWAGVGAVFGLASLCRPPFLIWLASVWLAVILIGFRRQVTTSQPARAKCTSFSWSSCFRTCWLKKWSPSVAVLLASTAVLAPWICRNYIVLGKPIVGATHGGYTLWLGNNPQFYEFLRTAAWGDVWDSTPIDRQQGETARRLNNEVAEDQWAYDQAVVAIKESPRMFAYACLVRIGRFWNPLPHLPYDGESTLRAFARYTIGAWNAAILLAAAVGLFRLRSQVWQSPWLWGLLLALALTAVHSVFWSNIRMRAPVEPFVCLLAAYVASRPSVATVPQGVSE